MMSRSRPYTRKELESLRRADLQNLYKIHGLKGANRKSDVLLESLVEYFASPSFAPPPSSPAAKPYARKGGRKDVKVPFVKSVVTKGVVRGVRPRTIEVEVVLPSKPQAREREVVLIADLEEANAEAGPSRTPSAPPAPYILAASPNRPERPQATNETGLVPSVTITSGAPSSIRARLGKRPHHVAATETSGIEQDLEDSAIVVVDATSASPARKRARIQSPLVSAPPMEADDSLTADEPRTPSRTRVPTVPFQTPAMPRTPSPSHQGVIPDNSASPGIASDFFANPPPFTGSGQKKKKAGPIEQLPYPIFATTPKPSAPTSPTTDMPAATSRRRDVAPGMLTPGRRSAEPATRAVSDAHKELSTITESVELRFERPRLPSDAPTPTFLGPELRGSTSPPPRLSASPTIGRASFSYPAFPRNPASRSVTATPPRRFRGSSSPARDYMEVALYGLHDPVHSPSAQATPGHRTMLGTERYRDTRFGDVPVFQWGTPNADLGPGTPGGASLPPA